MRATLGALALSSPSISPPLPRFPIQGDGLAVVQFPDRLLPILSSFGEMPGIVVTLRAPPVLSASLSSNKCKVNIIKYIVQVV